MWYNYKWWNILFYAVSSVGKDSLRRVITQEVIMKLENTIYANYKLVIDEFDIPVAVQVNGEIRHRLYDEVYVKADCIGYICEGITHDGYGTIVRIRRNDSDYFFGVLMDNGEFGYMKNSRMTKIWSSIGKKYLSLSLKYEGVFFLVLNL